MILFATREPLPPPAAPDAAVDRPPDQANQHGRRGTPRQAQEPPPGVRRDADLLSIFIDSAGADHCDRSREGTRDRDDQEGQQREDDICACRHAACEGKGDDRAERRDADDPDRDAVCGVLVSKLRGGQKRA